MMNLLNLARVLLTIVAGAQVLAGCDNGGSDHLEAAKEAATVSQCADKEKIRQLLLKRRASVDREASPEQLAKLRQIVTSEETSGQEKFSAAVDLAIHGDATGADILLHLRDYFTTQSGLENERALAALVLIDRVPNKVSPWAFFPNTTDLGTALFLLPCIHVDESGLDEIVWPPDLISWPPPPRWGSPDPKTVAGIRKILQEDLNLSAQATLRQRSDLRESLKSETSCVKRLHTAVALAVYGDGWGVDILRHPCEQVACDAEVDIQRAFAALVLLGSAPDHAIVHFDRSAHPRLYDALIPYMNLDKPQSPDSLTWPPEESPQLPCASRTIDVGD